jgi:hypothetical protein
MKDAFILSDVREPTLTIVCEPCGRRGRYSVERLMAKHGDTKLLYLLPALTNCPKIESANIYDRCKARSTSTAINFATCCRTRRRSHAANALLKVHVERLAPKIQPEVPWEIHPRFHPKAALAESSYGFKFTVCVLNKNEPTSTRLIPTTSQVDVPI